MQQRFVSYPHRSHSSAPRSDPETHGSFLVRHNTNEAETVCGWLCREFWCWDWKWCTPLHPILLVRLHLLAQWPLQEVQKYRGTGIVVNINNLWHIMISTVRKINLPVYLCIYHQYDHPPIYPSMPPFTCSFIKLYLRRDWKESMDVPTVIT